MYRTLIIGKYIFSNQTNWMNVFGFRGFLILLCYLKAERIFFVGLVGKCQLLQFKRVSFSLSLYQKTSIRPEKKNINGDEKKCVYVYDVHDFYFLRLLFIDFSIQFPWFWTRASGSEIGNAMKRIFTPFHVSCFYAVLHQLLCFDVDTHTSLKVWFGDSSSKPAGSLTRINIVLWHEFLTVFKFSRNEQKMKTINHHRSTLDPFFPDSIKNSFLQSLHTCTHFLFPICKINFFFSFSIIFFSSFSFFVPCKMKNSIRSLHKRKKGFYSFLSLMCVSPKLFSFSLCIIFFIRRTLFLFLCFQFLRLQVDFKVELAEKKICFENHPLSKQEKCVKQPIDSDFLSLFSRMSMTFHLAFGCEPELGKRQQKNLLTSTDPFQLM